MIVQGKLEALQRAKEEHRKLIEIAKSNVDKLDDEESSLETQTELEDQVESQESELEETESLILIKGKGLTEEQKAKLLALIEEFKQGNSEFKVKVASKKDAIKVRLKAQGLSEEEIELKIEEKIEKVKENREKVAQHQVDQATKMYELASKLIEKAQNEKNVAITQETLDLKAKAEAKLGEAKTTFETKEFVKAIELARDSKKLSALTIASIRGVKKDQIDRRVTKIEEREEFRKKVLEERKEFRDKLLEIKENREESDEEDDSEESDDNVVGRKRIRRILE